MSNHSIGYAMGPILMHLMELREKKIISDEATKLIVDDVYDAVREYFGNKYEASELIDHAYCGHCGRHLENGEELYNFDDFMYSCDCGNGMNYRDFLLFSDYLCEKCFKEGIKNFTKDLNPSNVIKKLNSKRYFNTADDDYQ